jgi:hypothetical protein
MTPEVYRFEFSEALPTEEIEATLTLAILATESLHGEAQVRLDAGHCLDREQRVCVIDAATTVGRDLNRLFVGFLNREFGEGAFRVARIAADQEAACA